MGALNVICRKCEFYPDKDVTWYANKEYMSDVSCLIVLGLNLFYKYFALANYFINVLVYMWKVWIVSATK